jgi:hypothetical protein
MQDATWLAAGAVAQAPSRQTWPLLHCPSLPHAGERQTASSQTSPALPQSAVVRQLGTQAELMQS